MKALGTEPIGNLLLRYSMPAITGMVAFSLYNIVDSIFIGHKVGALALSGLAVAFPVMNLIFAISLLFGIGGASIISIRIGQKNIIGAHRVLGNVLILSLVASILFGIGLLTFLDPILISFGASQQTLPYAHDFMTIIILGMPISYTMFNLNHLMRATGYPKKAMLSALITVGYNIILAPLFIFYLEWGIRGAALATIFSQIAGLVWVLYHFRNPNNFIHFQPGIYKPRKNIIKSICAIGLSPCLMNMCGCIVVVIINNGLLKYGGDLAVGAFGIINRVLILFGMVVVGLTQGMQPIVGYNYGAKNMDRVKKTLRYGIVTGMIITTTGFLASELLPHTIIDLFSKDEKLIEFSVTGLRLSVIAFTLVGAQIVIGNFFQAIGQAKLSIILSLTRQLLFLVPCLLIFPNFWGQNGIWISLPISDALSFIVSFIALVLFLRSPKVTQWDHTRDPLPELAPEKQHY